MHIYKKALDKTLRLINQAEGCVEREFIEYVIVEYRSSVIDVWLVQQMIRKNFRHELRVHDENSQKTKQSCIFNDITRESIKQAWILTFCHEHYEHRKTW